MPFLPIPFSIFFGFIVFFFIFLIHFVWLCVWVCVLLLSMSMLYGFEIHHRYTLGQMENTIAIQLKHEKYENCQRFIRRYCVFFAYWLQSVAESSWIWARILCLVSDLLNILKQIKYHWKIKPTRIVRFTQNAEAIR